MAEVAAVPVVATAQEDQANGLAEEIIEEVQAKLNLGTATEETLPDAAVGLEKEEAREQGDESTTEEITDEKKKGDTINSSSSSGKDDDITEGSEVQKVTEKDSAGSKSRKSMLYRFRSWWTNMFAVKGEQPSNLTKVVGNLRNSLRRKNTGSAKKEDKNKNTDEISEEAPEKLETCEKDSNIDENKEIQKQNTEKEQESAEKVEENASKEEKVSIKDVKITEKEAVETETKQIEEGLEEEKSEEGVMVTEEK